MPYYYAKYYLISYSLSLLQPWSADGLAITFRARFARLPPTLSRYPPLRLTLPQVGCATSMSSHPIHSPDLTGCTMRTAYISYAAMFLLSPGRYSA